MPGLVTAPAMRISPPNSFAAGRVISSRGADGRRARTMPPLASSATTRMIRMTAPQRDGDPGWLSVTIISPLRRKLYHII